MSAGTPAAVAGDPLIVRAAVDETASPAAADVAAARTIYANPSYLDSGTVELGDLAGFARSIGECAALVALANQIARAAL